MKAKHAALAAFAVGMLGAGIWWYTRKVEVAPVKAAQVRIPIKVVASPASAVEPPKLPPVAASSSPAIADISANTPSLETAAPNEPVKNVTEAGTIEFTEGVPVTVFGTDGSKWNLTAHRITESTAPGSIQQMQIQGVLQSPDAQQVSAPKITVLEGKAVLISVGDSRSITGIKFTAQMN